MPPKSAPAVVASNSAPSYPPNQTLYLTNLPSKLQKEDLRRSLYALFSTYGPVLDVVALKTMKMRGQGHIVFRDVQTATQAMRSLQGFVFFGMEMKIAYARSKSDKLAKLDGTFVKPAAAVGAVTTTELQQSIFNAPPSAAKLPAPVIAANLPAPVTAASLKPLATQDAEIADAGSRGGSVAGQKRRRDEESEEEEDSEGDAAMEEDSDDD